MLYTPNGYVYRDNNDFQVHTDENPWNRLTTQCDRVNCSTHACMNQIQWQIPVKSFSLKTTSLRTTAFFSTVEPPLTTTEQPHAIKRPRTRTRVETTMTSM